MKARQASVVVKYNDKDITKTITDYIEGFSYVDNASGSADTMTLKLNNRSGKWSGSWIPVQGDFVKTIIKLTNWNKEGDNRKFDCGYFLIDDLSFRGRLRLLQSAEYQRRSILTLMSRKKVRHGRKRRSKESFLR